MEEYKNWLRSYFLKTQELPENADSQNYFELGLIDSFGVMKLIEEIEDNFNIEFTQDHFQDRRFTSINGLATIISEIKNV